MKLINMKTSGVAKRYEFQVYDGHIVKAAYINRPEKHIICLSTQIGCSGGCLFCSTGAKPFIRNLLGNEMIEMVRQIEVTERLLYEPLLISFMGSGEPLENIKSVLYVIKHFPEFARFAVSVSGVGVERVIRLPKYVKVQFTLISPFEEKRRAMQPIADPLEELIYAVRSYTGPEEFNIPLIAGFNDDEGTMEAVATLSHSLGNIPVKLNKFHSVGSLKPSTRAERCLEVLESQCIKAEYYETDGEDILAACGQFDL